MTIVEPHAREDEHDGLRLQHCPRCNYSLRGLPRAGACPECGVTYPDCLAIRPARPPILAYAIIALVCLIAIAIGFQWWIAHGVQSPCCVPLLLPILLGSLAVKKIVTSFRMKRSKHELGAILLTDDGVQRVAHTGLEHWPWRCIHSMRIRRLGIRPPGARRDWPQYWRLRLFAWRADDERFHANAAVDQLRGMIDTVSMTMHLTEAEVATIRATFRRHGVHG